MPQTTAYSMINVSATLDGAPIVGLMDGDNAIEVSPGADVGNMLVGADGSSLFSQTSDHSAQITIRLQPTSPTHRRLVQRWMAQRAGILLGIPFSVIDSASNEGGATDKAFILQAATDAKGTNATTRDWVLVTGDWTPTIPDLS